MKLNLTNGRFIDNDHELYIPPGAEGFECGDIAPDPPYYTCSRRRGHENCTAMEGVAADGIEAGSGDARDHAAHGGRGKDIAMYARWEVDSDE